MNLTFYIAKRYLFSKKKQNIINIISTISMVAIAVGSAAMIVVLSVFNGFEQLGFSFMGTFDPPVRIEAKEGKMFDMKNFPIDKIKSIKNVAGYVEAIEENALLKYQANQQIVTLKGVSDSFLTLSRLDTAIIKGHFRLTAGSSNFAIMGGGIYYALGVNPNDYTQDLTVYAPKRQMSIENPEESFAQENIMPAGAFQVMPAIDQKYVIVPLRFLRSFFNYTSEVSSIDVYTTSGADINSIQKQIKSIAGDNFSVKNRFEQQELFYKTVKSEKLAIYIILSFILLIACFNATGSLSMLIMEKKHDMQILNSMGISYHRIRRIFFTEGMLISIIGGGAGLLIGLAICWVQQTFGLVKLSNNAESNFIITSFPVYLKIMDFLIVGAIVLCIGCLSAIVPCRKIKSSAD